MKHYKVVKYLSIRMLNLIGKKFSEFVLLRLFACGVRFHEQQPRDYLLLVTLFIETNKHRFY